MVIVLNFSSSHSSDARKKCFSDNLPQNDGFSKCVDHEQTASWDQSGSALFACIFLWL